MSEEKSGWTLDDMNRLYLESVREDAEQNKVREKDGKSKEKDGCEKNKNRVERKEK